VSKALAELQVSAFNPNLQIFVGGPQASLAPDKLSWRGTHLLKVDARQAVEAVTQRMDAVSRQHGVTPVAS